MGLMKRHSSIPVRLVRMLLVPSMFLVIVYCGWSVLMIAQLSVPCGESCYSWFDARDTNAARRVDSDAVHNDGNSLARDVNAGSVEQTTPHSWQEGSVQGHDSADEIGDVNVLISSGTEGTEEETSSAIGSTGSVAEGRQSAEHGSSGPVDEKSSNVRDEKLQTSRPGRRSEVMVNVDKLRISGDTVMKGYTGAESCDGRRVYVYDLPSRFNADLAASCSTIVPWHSLCEFFSNSGMGKVTTHDEALQPAGRWYETFQFILEILFHAKLLHYRCLTSDPASASLFYIPYYAGIDVLHWNFASNATAELRDQLSHDLVRWLEAQTWWHRKGGRDHVLLVGTISWDLRRWDNRSTSWGSSLLKFPQMSNLTRLLIERNPWDENDIGVPYPTYFHPSSDDDIRMWQQFALHSTRDSLVSFAGMPRPDDPDSIRTRLIQQCEAKRNVSLCRILRCHKHLCLKPASTMKLFLNSHYCMQPSGDSLTRRSIFDSLIAGCIPVLFDPVSAYAQYPWHLPQDYHSYSVYIPHEDVRTGAVDVVSRLQQVPESKVEQMRKTILLEIMPRLLYAQPGAKLSEFADAFDVSLHNMIHRANMQASSM